MELVRTKAGYLFDEIYILRVQHHVYGVEIQFDYERFGVRMRDVPPAVIPKQDWAASRATAATGSTPDEKRTLFAKSPVVERLFAEGSRHYNQANRKAEDDFVADADFLSELAGH